MSSQNLANLLAPGKLPTILPQDNLNMSIKEYVDYLMPLKYERIGFFSSNRLILEITSGDPGGIDFDTDLITELDFEYTVHNHPTVPGEYDIDYGTIPSINDVAFYARHLNKTNTHYICNEEEVTKIEVNHMGVLYGYFLETMYLLKITATNKSQIIDLYKSFGIFLNTLSSIESL